MITPHTYVMISSKGSGDTRLNAFDSALINAGIADFNYITVSSIIPRGCKRGSMEDVRSLIPGSFMYCVMSRISSDVPGEMISSSITCAFTEETVGVVTESSGNCPCEESERMAERMSDRMISQRNATLSYRETTSTEMTVEDGWGCCVSLCLLLY